MSGKLKLGIFVFCLLQVSNVFALNPQFFRFEYGSVLDWICPSVQDAPISASMVTKVNDMLPELEKDWQSKGFPMLERTYQLFSKDEKQIQVTVDLVLCEKSLSMSFPFLVNARSLLLNDTSLEHDTFNYYVYHMYLFRYLFQYIYPHFDDARSPLLKKYEKEDQEVINHLYPHAIMALVYKDLNRFDELEKAKELEIKTRPYGKRAWEIVDKEGYQVFIDELFFYTK